MNQCLVLTKCCSSSGANGAILVSSHVFLCLYTGTNGAVSLVGLLVSIVGGLVVGVAYYTALVLSCTNEYLNSGPPQLPIILVAAICGLLGSIIDSLLGATLQYSGHLCSQFVKHIFGKLACKLKFIRYRVIFY